jgi:hypothetical protein
MSLRKGLNSVRSLFQSPSTRSLKSNVAAINSLKAQIAATSDKIKKAELEEKLKRREALLGKLADVMQDQGKSISSFFKVNGGSKKRKTKRRNNKRKTKRRV